MKTSSTLRRKSPSKTPQDKLPKARIAGTPEEWSLRVHCLYGRWIVENNQGESIADAATREEAVELARQKSDAQEAVGIVLYSRDGQIEKIIDV